MLLMLPSGRKRYQIKFCDLRHVAMAHHLNRHMAWCGCHEILTVLAYLVEVFCFDPKSLHSTEFRYLYAKRNTQRSHSNTNWTDKTSAIMISEGLACVPVDVSSSNSSLFVGSPLYWNVASARFWFVVSQNWRIRPQNGNLLEELSS